MPRLYGWLADGVLVVHFLFIVFVVGGALLALRRPRIAWIHVPCALWGAAIAIFGVVCPLTPLENTLRRAAGRTTWEGSFIDRHLIPVVYPDELTRPVHIGLGLLVIALNVAIYARVLRRRRARGA